VYPQQNHREGRQGLVKEIRRIFVDIRTAFKTPIGMTPYQFIYGKDCHLPVELENKAYWAIKEINLDLDATVVK
jgi:hypothetical protein